MGFRDVVCFNQALLAKQGWRILTRSDDLSSKILKAKYFPDSNFLQAKKGSNPSYVWRSIVWGREILEKGARWRVRKGSQLKVFQDHWLPRPHLFKPITVPEPRVMQLKFGELLNESGTWNWQMIEQNLWPIDHNPIHQIPIATNEVVDNIVWHYDKKGEYNVKSGYKVAMNYERVGCSTSNQWIQRGFRRLWDSNIPNKVKIHVWRVFYDALPTRVPLAKRGMMIDTICTKCRKDFEDCSHVHWLCKKAQEVWQLTALWPLLAQFRGRKFCDLFLWVAKHGTHDDIGLLSMVSWSIWLAQNKWVFDGKLLAAIEVLEIVNRLWGEFLVCNHGLPPPLREPQIREQWQAPPQGILKVNVDASVKSGLPFFGVGVTGRDEYGVVVFALCRRLPGSVDPFMAEMFAVLEGCLAATKFPAQTWMLETDASNVVHAIANPAIRAPEAPIIDQIQQLRHQLSEVTIKYCPRTAHTLATQVLNTGQGFDYVDAIPICIRKAVNDDSYLAN